MKELQVFKNTEFGSVRAVEKDGNKRYVFEIVVDKANFCGGKNNSQEKNYLNQQQQYQQQQPNQQQQQHPNQQQYQQPQQQNQQQQPNQQQQQQNQQQQPQQYQQYQQQNINMLVDDDLPF